jgi:hypothetical protein
MITPSQTDFHAFIKLLEEKLLFVLWENIMMSKKMKTFVIPTPYAGMCIVVTKKSYDNYKIF